MKKNQKIFLFIISIMLSALLTKNTLANDKELIRTCIKQKDADTCYQLGLQRVKTSPLVGAKWLKMGCKLGSKESCKEFEKYKNITYTKVLSAVNQKEDAFKQRETTLFPQEAMFRKKNISYSIPQDSKQKDIFIRVYTESLTATTFPEVSSDLSEQIVSMDEEKKEKLLMHANSQLKELMEQKDNYFLEIEKQKQQLDEDIQKTEKMMKYSWQKLEEERQLLDQKIKDFSEESYQEREEKLKRHEKVLKRRQEQYDNEIKQRRETLEEMAAFPEKNMEKINNQINYWEQILTLIE